MNIVYKMNIASSINIVSKPQWTGWFRGLGSGGIVLQNVITAIAPWLVGGLAIYFTILAFKLGGALSNADGPEQRKEVKIKICFLIGGMILAIVGPTIVLILMNTIYKTVQIKSSTSDEVTNALKEIITMYDLNIPKYIL